MLAANLAVNFAKGKATQKAVRRFVIRRSATWPLLLALALADSLATRGPKADTNLPETVSEFCSVLIEIENAINEKPKQTLPVDGDDLMRIFQIKSGPEVGRLLRIAKAIVDANPGISKGELLEGIKKKRFNKE